MRIERARELLADYALGLLSARERGEVDAWIARSPELASEAQRLADAVGALTLSVQDEGLPAGAMERIRQGVRARTRVSAWSPGTTPADSRGSERAWRGIALAAAAAVVVVGGSFIVALVLLLGARSKADDLERTVAAAPVTLTMAGDGGDGLVFAEDGRGMAVLHGLAALPEGHHYGIWSEGPTGVRQVAALEATGATKAVSLELLPGDMTRMFVTVEVTGHAATAPTGREVMTTR